MAQKKVLIELRIRMAIDVPGDWDKDAVEFWLNESSHCLRTEIRQLHEDAGRIPGTCGTCSRASGFYVRDIPADEEIGEDGVGIMADWQPEGP